MSELPMRGHFRYLRFKTFPMTPRTPQCKVFCPLLSSSEHSGVPEDSKSQLFQVLGFTPTLGQSRGATNKPKLLSTITLFFFFFEHLTCHIHFSFARHLLINAWSSKLIWPITTSLCVPYTPTWKHLTSALWTNVVNFIFWLLHIRNHRTLSVITPFRLPCTPLINCAHLFVDCENTFDDCTNFFTAMPTILMIVWILLITGRILPLIQPICLTYHL
jgi:hypothetical protein